MRFGKRKIFLVIPTIRDLSFLRYWKKEFQSCHLIVVEDRLKKSVAIPNKHFASIRHYSWVDIDDELGNKSWIFSRKNSGIRGFGFLKAYHLGADVVITIDDDCYPDDTHFVKRHLENLDTFTYNSWVPTYPNKKWAHTRGLPYGIRNANKVVLSHGLWSGALDLDAKTESKLFRLPNEKRYPPLTQHVPFGYFYPMCIMNLAVCREIIPAMFFPMMGYDNKGISWGYDRFDDIWAGIFSKKVLDHLCLGVVSGSPFVRHKKASSVAENLIKEARAIKTNEQLWTAVGSVKLTKTNPKECYIELANKIDFPKEKYFSKLKKAMIIWANLF